jgi:hypothetical protein
MLDPVFVFPTLCMPLVSANCLAHLVVSPYDSYAPGGLLRVSSAIQLTLRSPDSPYFTLNSPRVRILPVMTHIQ